MLTHVAYYSTPFHPQAFGDALTDPAAWLGRSYYRIRNLAERLISNASIAQIETTIRMIAALEAAAAYDCITQITTPVTIIDPDIFAREAGEGKGGGKAARLCRTRDPPSNSPPYLTEVGNSRLRIRAREGPRHRRSCPAPAAKSAPIS